MSSLIKEINRSVEHLLKRYEKPTFSKLQFYREENLKKCTIFEEQIGTKYIRGIVYFSIIVFRCFSSTKPCLKFLLISFDQEIEGYQSYQSSLGNEVNFQGHNEQFPKYLS